MNYENIILNSSFISQLSSQLKRNFIPFWRNKFLFIFDLIFSLSIINIFIILFYYLINNIVEKKLNLRLLYENKTNVYVSNKDYIKNSSIFEKFPNSINIDFLPNKPTDIINFIDMIKENLLENNKKGGILIQKSNSKNITVFDIYNIEIYNGNYKYLFANSLVSYKFKKLIKNKLIVKFEENKD